MTTIASSTSATLTMIGMLMIGSSVSASNLFSRFIFLRLVFKIVFSNRQLFFQFHQVLLITANIFCYPATWFAREFLERILKSPA